jgi:hypothetical protein
MGRRQCELEGCSKQAVGGGIASRTAAASAVNTKAASSQLKATRSTASRMAEASAASTRAAPSSLKAIRASARRMVVGGGASTRAAPRQSLKLPAVCTARCVSTARRCIATA